MMTDTKTENIIEDEVLVRLERMLESMPENSRQPIRKLIKKRKVELGLMESDLLPAGYQLKKARTKPVQKKASKDTLESLNKIARGIGKIKETNKEIHPDIDVKDEPLKKERKIEEETDSYKY
jgi:hypothetical protein